MTKHNEMVEVLGDRTSELNLTFFQQITTFFHFDLGNILPW